MDNKVIIQLIKQEVEELRLLVDAIDQQDKPQGVLIDVTKSKIQTLVKVSDLLPSNGESTTAKSSEVEGETLHQEIIDTLVERNLSDRLLVADELPKTDAVVDEQKIEVEVETEIEVETEAKAEVEVQETEPIIDEADSSSVYENEITEESKTSADTISDGETLSLSEDNEEPIALAETEDAEDLKEPEEPIVEDKPKHMVLGEKFTKDKSLNEMFTSSKESNYRIKGKPVLSVKKSIGLNDRFMYTRELFNNDTEKYNATVEVIDSVNNFAEAIEFLDKNCKWPKNETSMKFMELIKRRFDN